MCGQPIVRGLVRFAASDSDESSGDLLGRFKAYLIQSGRSLTEQQIWLLGYVVQLHGEFQADFIVKQFCKKGGFYISRPTVFRTLTELVECGILASRVANGITIYFRTLA